MLSFETIETSTQPDASIIWLHGLGANGQDFVPIAKELRQASRMNIRFIFPNAPARPVTVNGGMVMPAWFDIYSMDIDRTIDLPQIIHSSNEVHALVDQEIEKGISSDRIILAGFSQGGAVVFHSALTYPKPLAGLLAMSTYFATQSTIDIHPSNANISILIQHGTADPVVPEILGQKSTQALKDLNIVPKYLTYPMEHSVTPNQIHDIDQWIMSCLT